MFNIPTVNIKATGDNLLVLSYLFGVTIDEILIIDKGEQVQKSA